MGVLLQCQKDVVLSSWSDDKGSNVGADTCQGGVFGGSATQGSEVLQPVLLGFQKIQLILRNGLDLHPDSLFIVAQAAACSCCVLFGYAIDLALDVLCFSICIEFAFELFFFLLCLHFSGLLLLVCFSTVVTVCNPLSILHKVGGC